MSASFYVRPSEGEQVQTTVSLSAEVRPSLIGCAVGTDGKPLADVLVVLYASGGTQPDELVSACYSDALGRFAFGPLEAGKLYQVSLYADTMRRRILEQPE